MLRRIHLHRWDGVRNCAGDSYGLVVKTARMRLVNDLILARCPMCGLDHQITTLAPQKCDICNIIFRLESARELFKTL